MIRLRFLQGTDLASKAIQWFSSGHVSHVDAVLPDGRLLGARSDVVCDVPAGVEVRPAGYSRNEPFTIVGIPCAYTQEEAFWHFLNAQLHKPYDKEAIWGFAFNRQWRDPHAWICSELQAGALEHCGIFGQLFVPANKITPVALGVAVTAAGGYVM